MNPEDWFEKFRLEKVRPGVALVQAEISFRDRDRDAVRRRRAAIRERPERAARQGMVPIRRAEGPAFGAGA